MWLTHWPAERLRRAEPGRDPGPLALTLAVSGGQRIAAVDGLAAAEGIVPGITLADARALLPSLAVAPIDPEADARALAGFVDWCRRYTPFTADDGPDAAILDITGCTHLFGGEDKLVADLRHRLARLGLTAGIAAADTPGAAWAWARYGTWEAVPPGDTRTRLAGLPVAALRLPVETVERLRELGLHRIGDLYPLPRAPLAKRCGRHVLERLDRVTGNAREPISPVHPAPEWRTRMTFPDGIGRAEDIAEVTRRLIVDLCAMLESKARGARRLDLVCYRLDGTTQRTSIGTGRANRDAAHLMRLFREKLDRIEPGFGIEVMTLEAPATDPLAPGQTVMSTGGHAEDDLDPLIDRLRNRLGADGVFRIQPVESHIPERAVTTRPATHNADRDAWIARQPRPLRLLVRPEPIDTEAPSSDAPPSRFTWRRRDHQVCLAEGPERIAPEWWRPDGPRRFRDYYRLEDSDGRRFWVFRDGADTGTPPPGWYMHGLFA